MFIFAISLGIYSYLIFTLGILHILYDPLVNIITIIYLVFIVYLLQKLFIKQINIKQDLKKLLKVAYYYHNKLFIILLLLFLIQALVNFIGTLGPELAFDALWYHLTLPKLYLLSHSIYHISGGLLYYSDMPKVGEMLYIGVLSISNEILAKIIHFLFGILVAIAIYKISRKFFSPLIALIAVVIFYSNLVVDWESITAYVDLIRTFFEVLALWAFINWRENNNFKWLFYSSIMLGLGIETKLLSLGSLVIYIILLLFVYIIQKKEIKNFIFVSLFFAGIALLVPSPWFVFSYINTGTPIYPFFTDVLKISSPSITPSIFIANIWDNFMHASDPVSPIYMIFLPLTVYYYSRFNSHVKLLVWYCVFATILVSITPQIGGGRFLLAYLPAYSIVCAAVMCEVNNMSKKLGFNLNTFLLAVIILISCISIVYRAAANKRYLPVILGQESKSYFLMNNLNFAFGDFYDTDDYFRSHIKKNDNVLLYGFHNLYYVDFPFIDSSWVKQGTKFNYIAVQNSSLPPKYKKWKLIYTNSKTLVKLYSLNGKLWTY